MARRPCYHVSIKDGMAGEGRPGEVKVDYVIKRDKQVYAYKIKDEGSS